MSGETPAFLRVYKGRLSGVLRWQQLDALWQALRARADEGWYVYAVGEEVPTAPVDAATLARVTAEIDALLRREHKEDYCGIVYADDLAHPTLVKVYDPNNLGVVCGYSTNPPLPGWVLSTMPPVRLEQTAPVPAGRKRWWQRLIGGG